MGTRFCLPIPFQALRVDIAPHLFLESSLQHSCSATVFELVDVPFSPAEFLPRELFVQELSNILTHSTSGLAQTGRWRQNERRNRRRAQRSRAQQLREAQPEWGDTQRGDSQRSAHQLSLGSLGLFPDIEHGGPREEQDEIDDGDLFPEGADPHAPEEHEMAGTSGMVFFLEPQDYEDDDDDDVIMESYTT